MPFLAIRGRCSHINPLSFWLKLKHVYLKLLVKAISCNYPKLFLVNKLIPVYQCMGTVSSHVVFSSKEFYLCLFITAWT